MRLAFTNTTLRQTRSAGSEVSWGWAHKDDNRNNNKNKTACAHLLPRLSVLRAASIVGTINDLVLERSLTREDYNKCPILPEWTRLGEQGWPRPFPNISTFPTSKHLPTSHFLNFPERIALGEANASSALAGASDKPAAAAMLRPTFTHTPWQRPREWAYGQIAGPPAPPLVP